MGYKNQITFSILIFLFLGLQGSSSQKVPSQTKTKNSPYWVHLENGLDFGAFPASQKSIVGDSLIRVLRIDPEFFKFKLLNASAQAIPKRYSTKGWAKRFNLVAAINASMYQADRIKSVSLMKTVGHINNKWFSKDRTLLAFDPKDSTLPKVQILDRDCQNVPKLRKNYQTLIQSIRMISCDGKNVWENKNKIWSTSAIGMDSQGNILFIHSRSPYSTHDLIEILLKLPINIKRAMYVEGGSEAQMYINSKGTEYQFVGSYSTRSNETNANTIAWPIPNVVGIVRKTP